MVTILIISLLIQIALLLWFGKWVVLMMAIGTFFIMALAWKIGQIGEKPHCIYPERGKKPWFVPH